MADIKYTDLSGLEHFSDTIKSILDNKANTSSLGSYYTKAQVNNLLSGKSDTHSHNYLPLGGGTLTGDLNFQYAYNITWADGSWWQRINITDDSNADTPVFKFQQSSDTGSTWTDLLTIRDNGKVIANTFIGNLNGKADTAGHADAAYSVSSYSTASSSSDKRKLWFDWSGYNGYLAVSDNLTFQTSTNTLFSPYFSGYLNGSCSGSSESTYALNPIELYVESLNDLYTPGRMYYAGGGNSVTNKPIGVDAFGILNIRTAIGLYGQLLMSSNLSSGLYYRTNVSSSDGSWKTLLDSSNYTTYCTPANIGAAAASHGNHVPAIQTASNKVFLRNDNTWQTVTPANIGAAEASHGHGNTYFKVNDQTTTGAGDIYLEFWRDYNASWKILNSSGTLYFQNNYTSTVGNYFNAFTMQYNTGNAWCKGSMSADGGFIGNLTGNCSGSAGSVAWSNVSGKPSTFTPSTHSHDYLPLSGGTISNADFSPLTIERTSTANAAIGFKNSEGMLGHIAIMDKDGSFRHYNGDATAFSYFLDTDNYKTYCAESGHNHNTSYYTKTEVNNLLANKSNTHTHPYLSTSGGVLAGDLNFNGIYSIKWNDGTYHQRIAITDDATADTNVFSFQQSTNSGSTWNELFTVKDNGKVIAAGFNKSGSSDSYVLLGAGGHKAVSDFATSSHDHSGVYYSATVSRTKNTVLAAPNGSNGAASFRSLVAADIPNKLNTTTIENSQWGSQLILNRTSSSGSWGPSILFNYDGTCNGSLTMASNKLYVGDNGNSRTEVSLVGHNHDGTYLKSLPAHSHSTLDSWAQASGGSYRYVWMSHSDNSANVAYSGTLMMDVSTACLKTALSNDYSIIGPGYIKLRNYDALNPTGNKCSIEFSYNGGQEVYLAYTPNDSYRVSKGLKVFGSSNDNVNCWFEVEGNCYAKGFYQTSDERHKDFSDDIQVDLDKIKSLPKKYFTWKNDESKENQIGTSAQAIQEIYPELVSTNTDGTLSVAYDKLSVIALAAIDKIQDDYNTKIKELEDKYNKLEQLVNKLIDEK